MDPVSAALLAGLVSVGVNLVTDQIPVLQGMYNTYKQNTRLLSDDKIAIEYSRLGKDGYIEETWTPDDLKYDINGFGLIKGLNKVNKMIPLIAEMLFDMKVSISFRKIERVQEKGGKTTRQVVRESHIITYSDGLKNMIKKVEYIVKRMATGREYIDRNGESTKMRGAFFMEVLATSAVGEDYKTPALLILLWVWVSSEGIRGHVGDAIGTHGIIKVSQVPLTYEVSLASAAPGTLFLRAGYEAGEDIYLGERSGNTHNVYIVGKTGTGKSTTGNLVVKTLCSSEYAEVFGIVRGSTGTCVPKIQPCKLSGTKESTHIPTFRSTSSVPVEEQEYQVIDTPGLYDESKADPVYLNTLGTTIRRLKTASKILLVVQQSGGRGANEWPQIKDMILLYTRLLGCDPINKMGVVVTVETEADVEFADAFVKELGRELENYNNAYRNIVSRVIIVPLEMARQGKIPPDEERKLYNELLLVNKSIVPAYSQELRTIDILLKETKGYTGHDIDQMRLELVSLWRTESIESISEAARMTISSIGWDVGNCSLTIKGQNAHIKRLFIKRKRIKYTHVVEISECDKRAMNEMMSHTNNPNDKRTSTKWSTIVDELTNAGFTVVATKYECSTGSEYEEKHAYKATKGISLDILKARTDYIHYAGGKKQDGGATTIMTVILEWWLKLKGDKAR